jgi:glycosyltransferase involved in cell wall biosynthesis
MPRGWRRSAVASRNRPATVLVGHPFIPKGMGEHIRSSYRAFQAAGLNLPLRDVFGYAEKDPDLAREFDGNLVQQLSEQVNIYHMNGDEVPLATATLARDTPTSAYNIIYPAWELSKYPAAWATQLELFDEIWAPSAFIRDCLQDAVNRPVFHMPLACELRFSSFLGRRYFGIPESAFVFLFMFDLASYIERKNPVAVMDAYAGLMRAKPHSDACLVVKVNGTGEKPEQYRALRDLCASRRERVVLIDRVLSDNEVKNLVRCADCFVSLHRSEGFGRGMSEAMFLGKPVIATAYSGNMDFTSNDNACLVDYRLIPVQEGQYLFPQGQVWADPDLGQAVEWMAKLSGDRDLCRRIGRRASRDIRAKFSYRAAGLRYRQRVEQIVRQRGRLQPAE